MLHAWNDTVNVLIEIEKEMFGRKAEDIASYRQFGPWLIRSKSWPFEVLKTANKIPGLRAFPSINPKLWKGQIDSGDWGGFAGPIFGWLLGSQGQAYLKADAFYAYKYIVGIYFSEEWVIKAGLTPNSHKTIIKEATTMKWLQENIKGVPEGVFSPNIIESKFDCKHPFFIQKLVTGKALIDTFYPIEKRIKLTKRWLNILDRTFNFTWNMYEQYGLEKSPLSDVYPRLVKDNNSILEQKGLDEELLEKMNLIVKKVMPLIRENRLLPCSIVHNDLSSKNVILDGKKIWLIDWGNSKVAPIIEDQENLVSMSGYNKYFSHRVFEKFNKAGNNSVYTFQQQHLISRINHLYGLIEILNKSQHKRISSKMLLSYYPLEKRIKDEADKCYWLLNMLHE